MSRRRSTLLVLAAAALVAAVLFHTWVVAQLRAAAVIGSVAELGIVTGVFGALTREPREADVLVGRVPSIVVRPGGDGPWPAVVLVNGVTRRGRHHPTVRTLARSLARSGYLVLVPDPHGLARGELTARTLRGTVRVARAATRRRDVRGRRVAFIGVSAGGSLALLAAADPRLAPRVSVVTAIAPYTDLVDVVRLATTGFHREGRTLVRYEVRPFVALVAARSLAASLPAGRDRSVLLDRLRSVPDDSPTPLAALRRRPPRRLGSDGRALVALLTNRDPNRFERLFAALPATVRTASRRLSPLTRANRLAAPVELVSAPHDKYFPPAESHALVRSARRARLTISETLQHADLELSLRQLADLARLDAFVVRSLRAASQGSEQ